jgi:uncharacterized protein (DUF1697 family)
MFSNAGCENVQTYIQSGNVVFSASASAAAKIATAISKDIKKQLGHEVPVVVRTAEQMKNVIAGNPFAKRKDFSNFSHVVFFDGKFSPTNIKQLDPKRSPGDEFACSECEVYLWLPNGAGQTKLNSVYLDKTLARIGTQRNWRTVVKLDQMLTELGGKRP